MEITWHGYNCFDLKNKSGIVVVNPFKAEIGLKLPGIKADAVIFTDENGKENNTDAFPAETKIFNWPGEYEISGIAITVKKLSESCHFVGFDIDNIRICYLTDLTKPLTDETTSSLSNVDILIVPVDQKKGGYANIHQAIEELEPRIVIPIYYATPGLKVELDEIGQFLKKAGLNEVNEKEKFVASSVSALPQEKTEFVILKPQLAP